MLWFCCLPVASLIVGRVQRSNLSKSGSEAHYSSTFTIMIKTKIHPHALLVHGWSLFWFIKAKKITDIPQTQAGFKAKSLGILCGFQGFLTHNPAVFVEIDDIFDFSDPPWSKTHKCSLYSFQCFYFTVRYIGSISDPTEILFKPFFNRWPPKVSPVNHIEGGCKSISPYGMIISNSFTSRSTRGHSPQNLPE